MTWATSASRLTVYKNVVFSWTGAHRSVACHAEEAEPSHYVGSGAHLWWSISCPAVEAEPHHSILLPNVGTHEEHNEEYLLEKKSVKWRFLSCRELSVWYKEANDKQRFKTIKNGIHFLRHCWDCAIVDNCNAVVMWICGTDWTFNTSFYCLFAFPHLTVEVVASAQDVKPIELCCWQLGQSSKVSWQATCHVFIELHLWPLHIVMSSESCHMSKMCLFWALVNVSPNGKSGGKCLWAH